MPLLPSSSMTRLSVKSSMCQPVDLPQFGLEFKGTNYRRIWVSEKTSN